MIHQLRGGLQCYPSGSRGRYQNHTCKRTRTKKKIKIVAMTDSDGEEKAEEWSRPTARRTTRAHAPHVGGGAPMHDGTPSEGTKFNTPYASRLATNRLGLLRDDDGDDEAHGEAQWGS